MATIERTAYPRFPKVLVTKDLQACYTPQPDELEWARRSTRGGVACISMQFAGLATSNADQLEWD